MSALEQPAFPVEEYRSRVAQVQARMRELGLDALLLRDRANICYLTGFENGYMVAYHAAIVPAAGEPVLVASDFEMLNALAGSWCRERVTFAVLSDPFAATCGALEERGWARGRVGVETSVLSAAAFRALSDRLPQASLVDLGDAISAVKSIKSRREIEYLRQAGRLTTRGMQAALAEVAAGTTDNQVAAVASATLIAGGSEFPCIEPIVTVGERSGLPHSTFRRTTIGPGDAVLIEIAGCICRYSAPLMRSAAVEPVSADVRRAADACRDSLNLLIDQMRPGALAADVARRARAAWTPLCDELIWHGIYAYSVGLGFPPDWNDTPLCVRVDSDFSLQPGMCFHATTSLRRAGKFGTAMSETVLITEQGCEVLTGTPRELLVV
jgi:Xaa-Pro dipeptidase